MDTSLDFALIIQLFALSFLNDKILKGFDKVCFTGMILIDLQKAFDTIDHKLLLEKMIFGIFRQRNIMV